MISEIRSYTRCNPELLKSHHFLFDLPLGTRDPKVDFIVMGINPGETKRDWSICPIPTEETREHDFHEEHGLGRNSIRWTKNVEYFCGTKNVVLSEFFFWSSGNMGAAFEDRFGRQIWQCTEHLEFCATLNLKLIEKRRPKMVLAPGLGAIPHVKALYGLNYKDTVRAENGHRLVEIFRNCTGLPFLFTKHWSGGRGFSNVQKETVRRTISQYASETMQ